MWPRRVGGQGCKAFRWRSLPEQAQDVIDQHQIRVLLKCLGAEELHGEPFGATERSEHPCCLGAVHGVVPKGAAVLPRLPGPYCQPARRLLLANDPACNRADLQRRWEGETVRGNGLEPDGLV